MKRRYVTLGQPGLGTFMGSTDANLVLWKQLAVDKIAVDHYQGEGATVNLPAWVALRLVCCSESNSSDPAPVVILFPWHSNSPNPDAEILHVWFQKPAMMNPIASFEFRALNRPTVDGILGIMRGQHVDLPHEYKTDLTACMLPGQNEQDETLPDLRFRYVM